jgi:hypothetical protein
VGRFVGRYVGGWWVDDTALSLSRRRRAGGWAAVWTIIIILDEERDFGGGRRGWPGMESNDENLLKSEIFYEKTRQTLYVSLPLYHSYTSPRF